MSCLLTQGFDKDCKDVVGGIREIFFGNFADFQGAVTFDGTTGEIDSLPTATLYRYVVRQNTSSFTETGTPSEENGTLFYAQSVTAVISKLSSAKRKEMQLLAQANPVCFIRDFNDNIFMIGRTNGCLVQVTAQTGTAKGDLSGYTLTVTAEEKNKAELAEPFTTVPFDNFIDITVSPAYVINS